jgi:hypothetical protein
VPTNFQRFDIVNAAYDPGTQLLTLTMDANGPPLNSFQPGVIDALLQPAFFRVTTAGVPDSLPDSASVQIQFEATVADANGLPVESPIAVPLTAEIADFNNYVGASGDNSDLQFVRFEILFDVDKEQLGLMPTNPIPALNFMRMPFRY